MLTICFTFDYELFFGENYYSEDKVLFEPTEKLMSVLNKNKVSGTFFADVCSIPANKKIGNKHYTDSFTEQIKKLSQNGQDVQLHIHPHWLTSRQIDGKWEFDSSHYMIHSFGFDSNNSNSVQNIVHNGIEYLNNTIDEVKPNYKCIAYRAGGFCIQPHKELVELLYDAGIRVDSSIAPYLTSGSKINYYDYRNRSVKGNWWLSSNSEWWEDGKEGQKKLMEIPIATIDKNPIYFGFRRLINKSAIKLDLGEKRGSYLQLPVDSKPKFSLNEYLGGYNSISLDAYKANFLYEKIRRLSKKYNATKDDVMVAVIGHPKLITDTYLDNLSQFINILRNDKNIRIMNISEAYKEWMKKYD